jgi:hypothetical protein
LLAGAPVDGPILHAAIESHGAIVAAEWSPWGSWTAGHDVVNTGDPIAAIADKYRRDAVTARTRRPPIDRWIDDSLAEVDAVVVSLPPDDAVFGWDYPALSRRLDARNVPHVCVRSDPSAPLASADQQRLAALMTRAAPRMEARHG